MPRSRIARKTLPKLPDIPIPPPDPDASSPVPNSKKPAAGTSKAAAITPSRKLSRSQIVKSLKGKHVKVKCGKLSGVYYCPQESGSYERGVIVPDDESVDVMEPREFECKAGYTGSGKWKCVIKAVLEDDKTCEIDRWLAVNFPKIASDAAKKFVKDNDGALHKTNTKHHETAPSSPSKKVKTDRTESKSNSELATMKTTLKKMAFPAPVADSLTGYIEKLGEMIDSTCTLKHPGCDCASCLMNHLKDDVYQAMNTHLETVFEEMVSDDE